MLASPNELDCLSDPILECTLPIDQALSHDWTFKAYNADVPEDYIFRMSIVDLSDNSQVHSTTTNTITMAQYDVVDIIFTPWNGWVDGSSYNISFSAVRANDNSNVGNTRYFHATFEDTIDVAILSSSSTPAIKQDLSILGMTYTQFTLDDWSTYLEPGWISIYQKIVIPWQGDNSAKPESDGGDGYFEKLGDSSVKNTLESFMSAGGTVQIHLSSSTDYYGYSSSTGQSYLPFDMDIRPRDTAQTKVKYTNMEVMNPYHPIFDGVDLVAFQGFDAHGTVANAIINTKSSSSTSIPGTCDGYIEDGGFFQRLISSQIDIQDTVLGTCNYYYGGLIVTTINVESVSERADSAAFPLLGNMLSHHFNPYPSGFGSGLQGTDLTINGEIPAYDPFTGHYARKYMKSNAEILFNYVTTTAETLDTDWEISGPTDWQGNSMASSSNHTSASTPTTTFCKIDLSSSTGCLQGAVWEITLYLHDEYGNARIITVMLETDDARADEFQPIADVEIEMRPEYAEQIEYVGIKTVAGIEWPQYRIHLDDTGSLLVHFDAGNSSDEDAESGNGIDSYEWRVLFDKPYYDDNYNLNGHWFVTPGSSDGKWSYRFSNVTADPNSAYESLIRIELTVFDKAGYMSDRYKMYFSVVPEGFGDTEPIVQVDLSMNGTQVNSDAITISGTIQDGSEQGDVYVEVALDEAAFNAPAITKYTLMLEEKWDKSEPLSNLDSFELNLNIEDLYDNTTKNQYVFIMIYEGDDRRWQTTHWIQIILPHCQGLQLPVEIIEAEPSAYWIWNSDTNSCEWSGEYIDTDGDRIPDSLPDSDGDGTPDGDDAFPLDASEAKDSDEDGIGNNADAFPFDPNETIDSDGDGVGDNSDVFPNDESETTDTDGDGVGDNADAFPEDANETVDSDNDGVGDNSDVFPDDESESEDSDGDGVGDNDDAFPNNPSETKDSDGNGIGDNYQKQVEEEQRTLYIIIGIIALVVVVIAGVIYNQRRNTTIEEQEKQIDLANLAEPNLAQTEPTVTQQWTDESGYTWRMMSNGETMWWDGTDWKNL